MLAPLAWAGATGCAVLILAGNALSRATAFTAMDKEFTLDPNHATPVRGRRLPALRRRRPRGDPARRGRLHRRAALRRVTALARVGRVRHGGPVAARHRFRRLPRLRRLGSRRQRHARFRATDRARSRRAPLTRVQRAAQISVLRLRGGVVGLRAALRRSLPPLVLLLLLQRAAFFKLPLARDLRDCLCATSSIG